MAAKTKGKTDAPALSKAAQAVADKLGGGKVLAKVSLPTVILYDSTNPVAGGMLAGRYKGARVRETVNGDKLMHKFELIDTNCKIEGWDREARENIEIEGVEDMEVEIWGSALIDGILAGLEINSRLVLEYQGLQPHSKKGRKNFHSFVVVELGKK